MMKSLLNRLKTSRSQPLNSFYTDWINTLNSTLLPLLSHFLSSPPPDPILLSTHIDIVHTHFRSLFSTLDLASNEDVSLLLFPEWRNSLERPFLWLGDFHPYTLINLLRSFLDDDDSDGIEERSEIECLGRSWNVVMDWKNFDGSLGHKVEQMGCTLRLMVPAIAGRAREVQRSLVEKLGVGWSLEGKGFEVDGVVGEVMDELTCVFLDANRLRRSVLADILGALDVYQGALFLEKLAKFYVGFRDPKLVAQFRKSKLPLD